ncbi:helix-turn-helix transcriptional regulator [Bacillus sp. DTU_2020_1000418_1_SI_GHA_SEK_038]|uniref:helix-turn-helix domain-containing protein n=1 Tax=Bacillus sp. DTU_2020_1000418_1_SI_GHA_SEK_038 TaxID=3077585 RepID=UPI0028EAEE1C|nr:helix-turn-helix transcriptional regulator [Bacillus sp. DTU_2020_1000418_1_SI_GHA_SEK_038]WNS75191.1 helix-turn-helix transcriptional regulator [Bacillus sp. DTU_2020_1000418_1_SI_GHA_SEK_038]
MKTLNLNYIGHTLKRLRKSNLLRQEEFANQCNELDRKTISLLENNKQVPLLSTISSLAKGLQMTPSELLKEIEDDLLKGRYEN